ncbi:sialidase family protein [Chitinophaga qingshengii]|uniref:exo-alpha-sialidase n=1 Tax=Chitinophaga qingshengii TaxID=1569794 RepID=A0ABR7TTV9_9BACT|nr:sialidase family protein [Chitinophaga qingshengii]MBC9933085.1 exo-alpha-sialidase [Chitinophaga qingshengii]
MKITEYACLLWMMIFPAAALAQNDSLALFTGGSDGYKSYRIPVLLTAPNGHLLVFCEGRKESPSDAGDIDILLKRSADGGKTWSATQVVWDDGANTCGNPCPVVDAGTGTIWLLLTRNEGIDKEHDIIHKTATHTRTVWVCKSEDNGATWSAPADITATTKDPSWGWYATGPGIGIQVQHGPHKGRLVIPCDHSYDDSTGRVAKGPYEYGSHIIYSDDHGRSWQRGGNIRPKVNECQLTELADGKGSLLMSLRSYFGRGLRTQSISQDGGGSWSTPADVPALTDPICQASLIRYRWPSRKRSGILLFLNPDSERRMNMTLKTSTDDGRSWQPLRVLHAGPAAYSALAVLPNGDVGCLYEAGEKSAYSAIIFQKINKKSLSHILQQ